MAWVLFEVFLALGLAVFIVWWTFPKSKKPPLDTTATTPTSVQDSSSRDETK